MATTKIVIRVKTLASVDSSSGTSDPLYLGVITKHGGREFPLRYQKTGLKIGSNELVEFGVNAPELPANRQIFDSAGGGFNGIEAFPLTLVERVYLRKESGNPGADKDDSVGIEFVSAFITDSDGTTIDWSNRNLSNSSGPSPFWLGNEFGQVVYLTPEVAS